MKNIFLLFAMLVLGAGLYAQGNVGINDPTPDPLAILDMESTTQGVLIPRMSEAERLAIPATVAQNGLLVYQLDNNAGFWYFDGTLWAKMGEASGRIVFFNMVSNYGTDPADAITFLGPTTTVTIAAPNQKVLVIANRAFGSTSAGGASGLDIAVGYRQVGSAVEPASVGAWIYGFRVAQNTRICIGISGIINDLPVGDYDVGMCGTGNAGYANWNYNEYGYVTAIVFE